MVLLARDVQSTLDAVWRMESGRLIGRIARMVGDLGLAEDLAQEALVDALERWPSSGIPDNPAAWLMTAVNHTFDLDSEECLSGGFGGCLGVGLL